MAIYGRNSESPVPILAAATPADCFADGLRGGAHRHQVHDAGDPAVRRLPGQRRRAVADSATPTSCPRSPCASAPTRHGFYPYLRDAETLSRPWVVPGTPGLEHRIGGLEKEHVTRQRQLRRPPTTSRWCACAPRKVAGIAARDSADRGRTARRTGDLLVVGWGSTYGAIAAAVAATLQRAGHAGVARPPALPEPASRRPRRHPAAASRRSWCPETEPGPARSHDPARRVPGRCRRPATRSRAGRSRSARSAHEALERAMMDGTWPR